MDRPGLCSSVCDQSVAGCIELLNLWHSKREYCEHDENHGAGHFDCKFRDSHAVSITSLSADRPLDVNMETVRTIVVISLFAALCAVTAIVLDQGFFAAIFAAEFAFALVEATRRS